MNVLTCAVEAVFDEFFACAPEATAELAELQGKVIELEVIGVGLCLFFTPFGDGVRVSARRPDKVDVRIAGRAFDLYCLARGPGQSEQRGRRADVDISGDVDLGRRFAALFADADVTVFDMLARVTGDAPAYCLQRRAAAAARAGARVRDSLVESAGDYLREEARATPDPGEIKQFVGLVDELRDACAQFQVRLRRHEKRQNGRNGRNGEGKD